MREVEEELKRTQKELADLKKEYQEFTYAVSHDLRAPFRSIEGFSQILFRKNEAQFDQEEKGYFDFILKGINQAGELLDSLVEFSRLNTRAEPFSTVDCAELLNEIRADLAELIDSKKAIIKTPNLPLITADEHQIKLVFFHLIQNALLYQPENNKPNITITAEEKETSWVFCVNDNGIGVRDNQIEAIFKVFKRDVGNEYPGKGMGLSIVKKILQRHGGDIWVINNENKGVSFYFSLEKEAMVHK